MKSKICLILTLVFLFSFNNVLASESCSPNGYTVLTVNGIFTNLDGAVYNKDALEFKLHGSFNNQPLFVDYLYNPTHLAGAGDLISAVKQGLFDEKSDYDLTEMLNDTSQKVTTEKILLVAHSQGNFYSNNFYDKVASKEGGVPSESIGVYGVATPASKVAGGGKYLTSDTDSVIVGTVGKYINILPPNAHIPLQSSDGNGHSFSDVYLKYQGDRIVSDIKYSLDKLTENDEQDSNSPCIYPPKLTFIHKVKSAAYFVADPVALFIKKSISGIFSSGNLVKNNLASVISAVDTDSQSSVAIDAVQNNFNENISTLPTEEKENINLNNVIVANSSNQNLLSASTPVSSNPNATVFHGGGGNRNINLVNNTENNTNTSGGSTDSGVGSSSSGGSSTGTENNNTGSGTGSGNTGTSTTGIGSGTSGGNTVDTTPPIVTLNGNNSITINTGGSYSEQGATASDNVDTNVNVVVSGNVNTSVAGNYTITYTATDSAGNVTTTTRTVTVVNSQVRTTPLVTLVGSTKEIITRNSSYTDPGATALGTNNETLSVVTSGTVNTSVPGNYTITYTTTDIYGNVGIAYRYITVASYKYIPKYKFGSDNGDGKNWQMWVFNGSNVYDWSDTYVNNYLKEQFKLQAYPGGFWCSQCLQRGIFNHDPQQGFEDADFYTSGLEDNPQNNMNGVTYDVVMQWDSGGYTHTISHDGIVDATGYTPVLGINNNMWVGWDGSFNSFHYFPSGNWYEIAPYNLYGVSGGDSMIMQPYPIYSYSAPLLSNQKAITAFSFNSLSPNILGTISESQHNISLNVPYGTDVANLIPTIVISDKASISPNNSVAQNFSNIVTYTVTAEDGSMQNYTVDVRVMPDSIPPPTDTNPPSIVNYEFNNSSSNITMNPTTSNPVSIKINATENVNWMSIKIEKVDDSSIYKLFQSDTIGCVDGTNSCTKNWNGLLSSGGLLQSGTYRIKLHMKDLAGNDFYQYLSPYVISVDTTL